MIEKRDAQLLGFVGKIAGDAGAGEYDHACRRKTPERELTPTAASGNFPEAPPDPPAVDPANLAGSKPKPKGAAAPGIANPGGACRPSLAVCFFNSAFQPHLDEMQHTPVNDPARNRCGGASAGEVHLRCTHDAAARATAPDAAQAPPQTSPGSGLRFVDLW